MPVRRFDYVALNKLSDTTNINPPPPPPPQPQQSLHRRHSSADLVLNSSSGNNDSLNNPFPVFDEDSSNNEGLLYYDEKAGSEGKALDPSGNSANLIEHWKPLYNYADSEVESEKPVLSSVDQNTKPAYLLSTEKHRKQQAYSSQEHDYRNAQEYGESRQTGVQNYRELEQTWAFGAQNYRELCQTGAIGSQNCRELGPSGALDFEQRKPPLCPATQLSFSGNEQRKVAFWSPDQSGLIDDDDLQMGNTYLIDSHGPHRGNAPWFGDRSSTGSNNFVGGRVNCTFSAGLQRQSTDSSYPDSFLSGDLPLPTLSPSISLNASDSAFFNNLYEEGFKYDDPRVDRHSSDSVKSWVQQTEESYNLQLTLALRLTADAALTEEFNFLGNNFQAAPDIPSVDIVKNLKVLSHRFWVNGSMSYFDKIEDGFYHIWGMNPHIWTICNDLEEGHQMPSLESLKSVDASYSSMEVILIDKKGDSYLQELVNKAIELPYGCRNSRQMVEELSKLVCMLMGGECLTEHGDLMMRWKASSKMLRDCLNSIILPIGSLSVGLCRHRALLFKTLADIIDLPCRIVRGCKYCGMADGSSCLVQCGSEREYLVDLIGKPGALSDPKHFASDSTFLSIASPLRMPEFKSFDITEDVRSLATQYSHVATSLQVAGPLEDSSGVLIASTSEQVTIEPMVSSHVSCTGTRPITSIEGPDATMFTGNKPVLKMPIPDEKLKKKVDEINTSNKFALASDMDGIEPPKLPDFSAAVGAGNAKLQQEAHIEIIDSQRMPVIAKSSDDHLQQVTMKEDMIAKTIVQNFRENDKVLVEHRQLASAKCPPETELLFRMHRDLQSMLKVSHNIDDDGGHKQTGITPQNRMNLELPLAMNGLEIPWEDLVLKERIGSGSFGTVHHADWHGSDVAVKILIDQDLHEERLKEFQTEVVIMARLRHPNIVLFMGAVTKRPNLSIVTEYLPRGSLYRLIHRSGAKELLDERRRLRMALDVAKGMNYLHRLNPPIVHRDLKSPNLLVDKTWTAKVSDFGLSRFKANTFISSKTAAGTPEWMAPEVLRDEPSNEKSDVYSFGVILWELVTMQQPWSGLSPAQVVGAVGFQNRRLTIPQDMHPGIATIIESCWANDSRNRPTFSSILESLKSMVKSPAVQPLHGGNS